MPYGKHRGPGETTENALVAGLARAPARTMETPPGAVQGVDLAPDLRVRIASHQGPFHTGASADLNPTMTAPFARRGRPPAAAATAFHAEEQRA